MIRSIVEEVIILNISISPPMSLLHNPAPTFRLQDQNGQQHTLGEYRGKYLLLYFYPKDMTPGCTIEALGFRDTLFQLTTANVAVVGVSADPCESHKEFVQRHQLNFTLLADPEQYVCDAYGVWQQKQLFGKKYFGVTRQSFLIDPKGMVIKHYETVDPKKHPQQVLDDVRALQ